MKKPKLEISVVSSSSGYSDECNESEIFYLGQWRKLGDRVPYCESKGWRKLLTFPIVYIGQGAGQLELPKWYGFGYGWGSFTGSVKATIIGNTIEPKEAMPEWMN